MRTRARILVAGLAGLAGLLVAEGLVRGLGVGPIPQATNQGKLTRKCDDARGYENEPGGSMLLRYRNRNGVLLQEVVASVNEQGFRGPVVPLERTAGAVRIACLGDSQTFGLGVGDHESWPAVMEATLRADPAVPPIEVLNLGVPGYEIEQEVAQLEVRALAFEPDLVVLGFFMNDTVLPGTATVRPDDDAYWTRELAPGKRPGFVSWARQRSKLFDLGADWMFRRLVMRNWIDERERFYRDDFEGWTRARAALRKARDLAEGRGARFVVLLVPLLMRVDDEILSTAPYRTVAAFCRAEGIVHYDPEPLFAGLEVDRMRVHPRDLHTNAAGHAIVGRGIAEWLRAQGMLALKGSR